LLLCRHIIAEGIEA